MASATVVWAFYYDGDGVRVKETYSGTKDPYTKLFLFGGLVEVENPGTGENITKYYTIAGMRVAVDDGTDLHYQASDHLSSASLVMNASGTPVSEQRYLPFGEVRDIEGLTGITETDFGYTGQRGYADFGLSDYRARFYSTSLGRFTQPDSIIPGAINSQSWNRFAYVNNSPIMYNDPTGHVMEGACGFGDEYDSWCLKDNDDSDSADDSSSGEDGDGDGDDGGLSPRLNKSGNHGQVRFIKPNGDLVEGCWNEWQANSSEGKQTEFAYCMWYVYDFYNISLDFKNTGPYDNPLGNYEEIKYLIPLMVFEIDTGKSHFLEFLGLDGSHLPNYEPVFFGALKNTYPQHYEPIKDFYGADQEVSGDQAFSDIVDTIFENLRPFSGGE